MCTTRVAGVVVGAVFTVVASRHKWLPMLVVTCGFCALGVLKKVRVFHSSCFFFFLVSNIFNRLSKIQNMLEKGCCGIHHMEIILWMGGRTTY